LKHAKLIAKQVRSDPYKKKKNRCPYRLYKKKNRCGCDPKFTLIWIGVQVRRANTVAITIVRSRLGTVFLFIARESIAAGLWKLKESSFPFLAAAKQAGLDDA